MRALAFTGERFSAHHARAIGLVHEVVAESELDDAIERVAKTILSSSPTGIAVAKELFPRVAQASYDETLELTAKSIAEQRTSPEGQEGLRAFLEKRRPAWME
jgi:methylglutaconyl-CoA hydratase